MAKPKDFQEFERHYRQSVDDILNQLQTVTLLAAQVQSQTVEIGNAIESLRQSVKAFTADHPGEDPSIRRLESGK